MDFETQQVVLHGIRRVVEIPEADCEPAELADGAFEQADRSEIGDAAVVYVERVDQRQLREYAGDLVVIGFEISFQFVDVHVQVVFCSVFFVYGIYQLDLDDVSIGSRNVDYVLVRFGIQVGVSKTAIYREIMHFDGNLFFVVLHTDFL